MPDLVLIANAKDNAIASLKLDDAGRLEPLTVTSLDASSSTFAVDEARNLVYAGTKATPTASPSIITFSLERATGVLTEQARRSVDAVPTYLEITPDGRHLLAASYHEGVGSVWAVEDGVVGELTGHCGYPNLHCVKVSSDGRFAYFVSLGDDLIAQFELTGGGVLERLDPPEVLMPDGCGPRHLILDADERNGYLVTEFSGEVIRLLRDEQGRLTRAEAISIVDPSAGLEHSRFGADPAAEHLIWGANVHLARDGRVLLATERCAGTIAAAPVGDNGRLDDVHAVRSTERQPRGFGVSSKGDYAVVVGEKGYQAVSYRVQPSAYLDEIGKIENGRGANWVRILPID